MRALFSRLLRLLHLRPQKQSQPQCLFRGETNYVEPDEGHETLYSPDPTNPGRVRKLWRHLTQFPFPAVISPIAPPRKLPRNHPTVRVPTKLPEPGAPQAAITDAETKKQNV